MKKPEEPEIKLPTFVGSWGKQGNYRKNIYFCFTDYSKTFDCVDLTNCGKFLKRRKYQNTLSASCETYRQVKKQQLEPDVEQTGSTLGKEYVKAVTLLI